MAAKGVGPLPRTVRVERVVPASRPGFIPVIGKQTGKKNEEFLVLKNVRCLVNEAIFFEVYIDNPYPKASSVKEKVSDGFVGSWIWSPWLGGGVHTHRLSIVQNLKARDKMAAKTVHVTIVTYKFDGNGNKKMFSEPVALIEKVFLEYE